MNQSKNRTKYLLSTCSKTEAHKSKLTKKNPPEILSTIHTKKKKKKKKKPKNPIKQSFEMRWAKQ
jgi:hypothetical protein